MAARKSAKKKEDELPPGRAPNPNSLNLTPEEAMSELRCSRAKLFELLRDKEIHSFLLGPNARRIPRTEIEAYMKRKLAEAAQSGSSVPTGSAA